LDLAEGVLQYAREHLSSAEDADQTVLWVGGDAEQLPLASASVDLIYSSLAIQWCGDLPGLFREIRRVLRPGGVALFSTVLDGTLWELREAWQAVDQYQHVNDFVALTEVSRAIEAAGFQACTLQPRSLVMQYAELRELTTELKKLGAHNLNQDRPAGMTGRRRVQRLLNAYEQYRTVQGMLPATWQVLYGYLVA
jgi:malonyl-CoA O-methyltransferase